MCVCVRVCMSIYNNIYNIIHTTYNIIICFTEEFVSQHALLYQLKQAYICYILQLYQYFITAYRMKR